MIEVQLVALETAVYVFWLLSGVALWMFKTLAAFRRISFKDHFVSEPRDRTVDIRLRPSLHHHNDVIYVVGVRMLRVGCAVFKVFVARHVTCQS